MSAGNIYLESEMLPNMNWLHVIFATSIVCWACAAGGHSNVNSMHSEVSQLFIAFFLF